jgi:hypothetical protein
MKILNYVMRLIRNENRLYPKPEALEKIFMKMGRAKIESEYITLLNDWARLKHKCGEKVDMPFDKE